MRYIGLDLGTKTLGVAISDLTATIATGLKTLRFEENKPENCFKELSAIIDEYGVETIIIGMPKNMNNTLGKAAERTESFIDKLNKAYGLPVIKQDERLSSVTANSVLIQADVSRKKRKTKVDSIAATIILQNYLDIRKEREKWKTAK